MKPLATALVWSLVCGLCATHCYSQITNRVVYTLLHGSYFLDQCLICGRPDIQQPLSGTFDLVLLDDRPPYSLYAVQNINFVAGFNSGFERRITGDGTYSIFEEFASVQDMNLATDIHDDATNLPAFFTNDTRSVQQPFPLIQISLRQTNGTLLQTFSLNLFAAPVREIWFSTSRPLYATNQAGKTNFISPGDLISTLGRVVKRNSDLAGRLGIMPVLPDVGLDAVHVTSHGEILFSIPTNVFSETLGPIQHGDLISNRGAIVKRNQELLGAFHPKFTNDAGLDAVQIMTNGEILFSVQSNVVLSADASLSRGDILSDQGRVSMTHQQLYANFHLPNTNYDYGVDALYIFPSGEVWFSPEESFTNAELGIVQAGDLLSSLGYRVFSNQDLVSRFMPTNPAADYGLDALFIVTDTQPPARSPQFLTETLSGDLIHLEWDGPGAVFQLQSASSLLGPWTAISDIIPDQSFDASWDPTPGATAYFRLQQW
jgi:hypothetical protein